MVRAILLANATAMTLKGRRAMSATIHFGSVTPRLACLRTDVAPTISRVRNCLLPRLEIAPSRSLPPLELERGVSPIQAARSRPVRSLTPGAPSHSRRCRASCSSFVGKSTPSPGLP